MNTGRSETHSVMLSPELRLERLPLGFAAGHWWLTLVLSARGRWLEGLAGDDDSFDYSVLSSSVQLSGPHGPFTALSSAGGGSNYHHRDGDVVHALYEIGLIEWVDIAYAYEGETVAKEHLDLSSPL